MTIPTFEVTLIGNLGGDPETKALPSNGQQVTNFNVACSTSKPDGNGGWTTETAWARCSAWGEYTGGSISQRCNKGDTVIVRGKMKFDPATGGPRIWQGQEGPRASFEVEVTDWKMLKKRDSGDTSSTGYSNNTAKSPDAEVPF